VKKFDSVIDRSCSKLMHWDFSSNFCSDPIKNLPNMKIELLVHVWLIHFQVSNLESIYLIPTFAADCKFINIMKEKIVTMWELNSHMVTVLNFDLPSHRWLAPSTSQRSELCMEIWKPGSTELGRFEWYRLDTYIFLFKLIWWKGIKKKNQNTSLWILKKFMWRLHRQKSGKRNSQEAEDMIFIEFPSVKTFWACSELSWKWKNNLSKRFEVFTQTDLLSIHSLKVSMKQFESRGPIVDLERRSTGYKSDSSNCKLTYKPRIRGWFE